MAAPKPGTAGATRTCPHCKTTILESASICPSCKHYLRFDTPRSGPGAVPASTTALQVEGMIRHPSEGGAWEYSVVLSVRDDEGTEITRHVVGVGAMFAKGDPLKAKVDEAIRAIYADGTFDKIEQKWVPGADIRADKLWQ